MPLKKELDVAYKKGAISRLINSPEASETHYLRYSPGIDEPKAIRKSTPGAYMRVPLKDLLLGNTSPFALVDGGERGGIHQLNRSVEVPGHNHVPDTRHALQLLQSQSALARAGATIEAFVADMGNVLTMNPAVVGSTTEDDVEAPKVELSSLFNAIPYDLTEASTTLMCQVDIPRRVKKMTAFDLDNAVIASIVSGMLSALDTAALAKLAEVATTAGIVNNWYARVMDDHRYLRAIIGPHNNPGITTDISFDRGELYCDGVRAVTSKNIPEGTTMIAGDFSSILILVGDELDIVAHKYNSATGRTKISAFMDYQIIILDEERFTKVPV